MSPFVIFLLIVSAAVLLIGTYLWRITGSRSVFVNTMFGTTCMMLSAWHVAHHRGLEWAVVLPFFTSMLFGGRALGTWWRSRREAELLFPAQLMGSIAILTLTSAAGAFQALRAAGF